MILDRLTVREKVNLLALIPLLVAVLLLVPLVATRLDQARVAAQEAQSADIARQVGTLAEQVQQVRLLSVAYLSGRSVSPSALAVALEDVRAQRAQLAAQIDPATRPQLSDALDQLTLIGDVEAEVEGRVLVGESAVAAYGSFVDSLIDALQLGQVVVASAHSQELGALDALLRSDEATSRQAALLLVAAQDPAKREHALAAAHDQELVATTTGAQFDRLADPSSAGMFALVASSQATQQRDDAVQALTELGAAATPGGLPASLFAAAGSQTQLRELIESQVAQGIVTTSQQSLRDAQWGAAALGGVGVALLIGVVLLSVRVGRSVSGPLRRLTGAASTVARLAQEELLRVADEDSLEIAAPRLAAIDVRSSDEIGDLAEAFNQVQATAALLLERQVVSRRNVASMFASVGRRTSNLVARQLALIDGLERAEDDPDTLATLYRLDHTATRLRRSASSLIVLSGTTDSLGEGQPMPVSDVVRAALGTVEEFQRFTLRRLPKLWIAPGVVDDLSLLLAELLENAALFSPPRSQVEVIGSMARDGTCSLSIIDHGMGMPAERIEEENARIRRRERLDLAPSDVLGLFVVGRIARRHDVAVHLEPTLPTGVTAVVQLPASVLVDGRAAGPAPARSINRRRAAAAADGANRRELAARHATLPMRPDSAGPSAPAVGRPAMPGPHDTRRERILDPVATGWPVFAPAGQLPDPRPLAGDPVLPVVPAPPPGAAADPGLTRRVRGANWTSGPVAPFDPEPLPTTSPGDVPAVRPAVPPAPTGSTGVARRVPGDHLAQIEGDAVPDGDGDAPTSAPPIEGLDPVAARRQVEDVERAMARAREVAEHGAPLPPPPTPAELGVRAGMNRRVPGAALESVPGGVPLPPERQAEPGAATVIDARQLRQALDEVDQAIGMAQDEEPAAGVTEQRLAAQAAQAAVRAAEGRRAQQHEAVETLAAQLRTGQIPLAGTGDEAPADAAPATAEVPRPVMRRVPGASLAALGGPATNGAATNGADLNGAATNRAGADGSRGSLHGTGLGGGGERGDVASGPPSGPISLRPERPEDVLAWARDLEEAMARVPDRPGHEGSGDLPDPTAGTSGDGAAARRPRKEGEDG